MQMSQAFCGQCIEERPTHPVRLRTGRDVWLCDTCAATLDRVEPDDDTAGECVAEQVSDPGPWTLASVTPPDTTTRRVRIGPLDHIRCLGCGATVLARDAYRHLVEQHDRSHRQVRRAIFTAMGQTHAAWGEAEDLEARAAAAPVVVAATWHWDDWTHIETVIRRPPWALDKLDRRQMDDERCCGEGLRLARKYGSADFWQVALHAIRSHTHDDHSGYNLKRFLLDPRAADEHASARVLALHRPVGGCLPPDTEWTAPSSSVETRLVSQTPILDPRTYAPGPRLDYAEPLSVHGAGRAREVAHQIGELRKALARAPWNRPWRQADGTPAATCAKWTGWIVEHTRILEPVDLRLMNAVYGDRPEHRADRAAACDAAVEAVRSHFLCPDIVPTGRGRREPAGNAIVEMLRNYGFKPHEIEVLARRYPALAACLEASRSALHVAGQPHRPAA
jgi:hypothetical protein